MVRMQKKKSAVNLQSFVYLHFHAFSRLYFDFKTFIYFLKGRVQRKRERGEENETERLRKRKTEPFNLLVSLQIATMPTAYQAEAKSQELHAGLQVVIRYSST